MTSLCFMSAMQLIDLLNNGLLTPLELMEETQKRIDSVNPILNAFCSLRTEQAMAEAKKATERMIAGEKIGPLSGIPIGIKDMEDVEGMVTSYGSIPFKDNVAVTDSIQVARLKASGAIVIGKTNVPEFGYTAFTKNRLFGTTRNPWDINRTPGGSSGGSAASVASGMVSIATGSDAGGSIRIPASYTGCFGLKPSFGRIPFGSFPLLQMQNLISVGPLTRSVSDAALFLDCVVGYHPLDSASLPAPGISYLRCLNNAPKNLKIAYSPSLGFARVQKDVATTVDLAVKCFEEMGHTVELWEGRLPDLENSWSRLIDVEIYGQVYKSIDNNMDVVGRAIQRAFEKIKHFTVNDQIEIQHVRTELNTTLWNLFERFDVLVTPTVPTEAFRAEGPPPIEIDGYPISLLEAVAFTYPFNLSGHPAATVPVGFTENHLPVGMQIVGPRYRDDLVLQMAHEFERRKPWANKEPNI